MAMQPEAGSKSLPHEIVTTVGPPSRESTRMKASVPKLPKGFKLVQGPAERTKHLWRLVMKYLDEDWASMRSMNLGVKSGTGVVDELLLRKVHTSIQELHMLAITEPSAAQVLEQAARCLEAAKMQQLQVLLDKLGHEHLSDYLRLAVFNVRAPFVKKPIDVVVDTSAKPQRRRRFRSPSLRHGTANGARSTVLRTSLDALPPFTGPRPTRDEIVRWAGLLPEEHPLVQAGYRLYLSRLPVDSPELQELDDYDDRLRHRHSEKNRYGHAMSLHDERALLEAARRRQPEIPLWTDVERLWQQTCHTHHAHDLLNPIMVSSATPLYATLPEFKRKLQEAEAARAARIAAAVGAQHPAASARRQIAPSRQPSMSGALPSAARVARTPRTPLNQASLPQDATADA